MGCLPRIDLHVHSQLSDGHGSFDAIRERACEQGLSVVAVTDHYDPMDPRCDYDAAARLQAILEVQNLVHSRRATRAAGAEGAAGATQGGTVVLVGIERGPVPIPGLPKDLDFVIGSVHYLTRPVATRQGDLFNADFWAAYRDDVLRLAVDPQVDVLGHIAGYLPMDPLLNPGSTFEERRAMEREIAARFFDRSWYDALFLRAAETGKAVELHCATRTPGPDEVRLGLRLGVKFSIGSDAHSLDRVGAVAWALDLLESLGATERDLFIPAEVPRRRCR